MKSIQKIIALLLLLNLLVVKAQYSNYSKYFNWDIFANNLGGGGGSVTLTINNNILNLNFSAGFITTKLKQGKIAATDYPGHLPDTEIPITAGSFFDGKGYRFFIIDDQLAIYHEAPLFLSNLSGNISVDLNSPVAIPSDISENLKNLISNNKITAITYLSEQTNFEKKQIFVTYFDGLGRQNENILVKHTPLGKDLINFFEYDDYGRLHKEYLPIVSTKSNGLFVDKPTVKSLASLVYSDEIPFSEKVYDNSPLDELTKYAHPGNAWQNGSGHEEKYEKFTNSSSDNVKIYNTTVVQIGNTLEPTFISSNTEYIAGSLYKEITKDEDWQINRGNNNSTEKFTNKERQTILVRKYLDGNRSDTYYIYDIYGNLTYIIPPLASSYTPIDQTNLDKLCYQYKYDKKNRLVEKKLPGRGWEFMVYDRADRLVATKDSQNPWLFTKYDVFGRVVYTGQFSGGTREAVQAAADSVLPNYESRSATGFSKSGLLAYYTSAAFPDTFTTLLSVNYYDTFPSGAPSMPASVMGQAVMPSALGSAISTRSLPTASYVKDIEDDQWTKEYTWYDMQGRPVASRSDNHLGGYTTTESLLDFAGVIQKTAVRHRRSQADPEVLVEERFTYDAQNRPLQHFHRVDSGQEELLSESAYDELGRLSTKKVGGSSAAPLQVINYSYNIRGWLTGINDPRNLGGKLFGMSLKYQNPENPTTAPARFNGNISEIDWAGGEVLKRYSYRYDGLDRMLSGAFSNPKATIPNNGTYDEAVTYDPNGNISSLRRYAHADSGNTTPALVDDLTYTYSGNQLQKVDDASMNPSGYEGGGQPIHYDQNGNMADMPDKGILQIGYNFLDLPDATQLTDSYMPNIYSRPVQSSFSNLYRADGVKVRKTIKSGIRDVVGEEILTIDYIDGFQYRHTETQLPGEIIENNAAMEEEAFSRPPAEGDPKILPINISVDLVEVELQFFPTAEGFYDYLNKQYIYQYKDHLGNVRLSYGKNSSGSAEVLDSNDYYPFGMNHINPMEPAAFLPGGGWQNYKFGEKELQETGMYDYGARFYMPDIGRWTTVDPLAEKYPSWSPYAYCYNNPIKFIDPTGMEGTSTDVRKNRDGSYTVVNARNDKDTNVYVVDEKGKRTGEVIAQTVNPWDFLSTKGDGGFGDAVTGISFRLDNLPSGDNLIANMSKDFKGKWDFGTPIIGLIRLAKLSRNNHEYDIKSNKKIAPQGNYSVLRYDGGNYASYDDGIPTITTARAIGNILFGKNMRSIYEANKNPGGDTANDFYNFAMPVVGWYNQRNEKKPFNQGYPFYGEHTLSGTYIFGGYFGNYK